MNQCVSGKKSSFFILIPVLGLWLSCFIAAVAAPKPVLYYDFEQQSGTSVTNLGSMGGSGTFVKSPL